MLTKEIVTDKIEILSNGVMQIREKIIVKEDGVEISSSFHRRSIQPGDDYSGESDKTKAIVEIVQEPDVVSAFRSRQAK